MINSQDRIFRWLTSSSSRPAEVTPLCGDVSRRRYFQVAFDDKSKAVAVAYPEDMRSVCGRFLETTQILQSVGIPVPKILLAECARGLMLVEDLGRTSFHDLAGVHWSHLEPLYSQALSYLEAIQQIPVDTVAVLNPALDGALLRQEVEISWRALQGYRPASLPDALRDRLEAALAGTCGHLEKCELVPCHRDFMARNLMLTEPEHILGVIDHQDLRLGPAAYDLASLLNDSLFPPPEVEERLRARQLDSEHSLLLYRRCAVQRTIKAAGTFVRFSALGDDRHLDLVKPTLCRAAHHLRKLPEGGSLADDLASYWEAAS